GFLSIPDDLSAYFYAQVGIEKSNRIHLSNLFSLSFETDLIEEDWRGPKTAIAEKNSTYRVLVHLGASEGSKCYPIVHWQQILASLTQEQGVEVVLIGSPAETVLADHLLQGASFLAVNNQIGKTSLKELFALLA